MSLWMARLGVVVGIVWLGAEVVLLATGAMDSALKVMPLAGVSLGLLLTALATLLE